jgi:hypothetical protein
MEQPPPQSNQENLFSEEELSMEGYDKHIRNARIMLFVVAGLFLLSLIGLMPFDDNPAKIVMGIILVLFAGVYITLAFWTKKKPFAALLTALIFFISLEVVSAILQPATIWQGWLLKIAVVVMLILGLRNAKDNQDLMKSYGQNL